MSTKIECLIRHTYAPELNELVLKNGARFPVPGCQTIKDARLRAFPKPCRVGLKIYVRSVKGNDVVTVQAGYVADLPALASVAKQLREKWAGKCVHQRGASWHTGDKIIFRIKLVG